MLRFTSPIRVGGPAGCWNCERLQASAGISLFAYFFLDLAAEPIGSGLSALL